MSRRLTALALAATLASFGTVAADDAATCRPLFEGDTGVERGVDACEAQVWFHAGTLPLGNTSAATGGGPTFDENEPGAGGGAYVTTSALHQQSEPFHPAESANFTGTFEGALDTLLVDMYMLHETDQVNGPTGQSPSDIWRVDAQLMIDGQVVAQLSDKTVPLSASGSVRHFQFGWVNIDTRMAKLKIDLEASHEITVNVHGTGIGTSAAVLVFDRSDAPSGMTFNLDPETLDSAIVGRA